MLPVADCFGSQPHGHDTSALAACRLCLLPVCPGQVYTCEQVLSYLRQFVAVEKAADVEEKKSVDAPAPGMKLLNKKTLDDEANALWGSVASKKGKGARKAAEKQKAAEAVKVCWGTYVGLEYPWHSAGALLVVLCASMADCYSNLSRLRSCKVANGGVSKCPVASLQRHRCMCKGVFCAALSPFCRAQ